MKVGLIMKKTNMTSKTAQLLLTSESADAFVVVFVFLPQLFAQLYISFLLISYNLLPSL